MTVTVEQTIPLSNRTVKSGLSTDSKGTAVAGSDFYETDTKKKYEYDGANYNQTGTSGNAHTRPIPGTGQTTKNRYIIAAAATHPGDDTNNSATWTAAENVTELTITVRSDTAEVAQADVDGVLVVFDALDGAAAKALLEDTAFDQNGDRQFDMIMRGQTKTYTGTSYFSRVDVVGIDGVCSVMIGAQ